MHMLEFCCWFSFISSSGESALLRESFCFEWNDLCGLSYRVSRGREGISLSAFLSVIVLLAFGFVVMYVLSIYLKYRKSSYCDEGGISFLKVLLDKGVYFEFLIFTGLKILERYHRLLTNICLPRRIGFSGQTPLFTFRYHRHSLVRAGLPSTVLRPPTRTKSRI